MFSKAKAKEGAGAPPAIEVEEAGAEREPQPVRRASGRGGSRPKPQNRPAAGVPTIISADMVIRGAVESSGEVQFDGEIDGDIRANSLVVGEGAKVMGEISAEKVRISGTVEGAVRAVEVELAASAYVRGDIVHTSLSIESGARLEGNVAHSDDPMNASVSRPMLSRPAEAITEEVLDDVQDDVVELGAKPLARRDMSRGRDLAVSRGGNDGGSDAKSTPVDRTMAKRPAGADLR